jgi:cell division protein FtsQ
MKARIWKSLLLITALSVVSIVGWGVYIVVHYLGTSPRFEVRKVAVAGLRRVESTAVLVQAGLPDKVNVFSVDLAKVRERVEELKWVRFATVQRVLPDAIGIKIIERRPVGLARIRGEILQFDAEAELLEHDPGDVVNAPILHGLEPKARDENKKKVALYRQVMEELHGQSELSEIHISDSGEVSVISQNEPLLVNLGAGDFRERWGQYLQLRAKIQTEFPEAVQVDLRFANQMILKIKPDDAVEEKVVWDAEKKSL